MDTWSSTLAQAGRGSVLTVYSGGRVGASYDVARPHGIAPHPGRPSHARARSAAPCRTYPSATADAPGSTPGCTTPTRTARTQRSGPGQFTRFWGFVGKSEHRIHFAGEHTSRRALGYLEGAVESGRRAAREVLAGL